MENEKDVTNTDTHSEYNVNPTSRLGFSISTFPCITNTNVEIFQVRKPRLKLDEYATRVEVRNFFCIHHHLHLQHRIDDDGGGKPGDDDDDPGAR